MPYSIRLLDEIVNNTQVEYIGSMGNDAGIALFRYSEKVEKLKADVAANWPEIPPESMNFFAGEVLASGVVLWALINNTGLDAMRWPGDLPVVLGLKVSTGSETKIRQILDTICQVTGLAGAEKDTLEIGFLELLQWKVVEQLHANLFVEQRHTLSKLLGQNSFTGADRAQILDQVSDFLRQAQIYAYDAQTFFERALKESLIETYKVFEENIPDKEKEKFKKLLEA